MDIREAISNIILKEEMVGVGYILKISSHNPSQLNAIADVEESFLTLLADVVDSLDKSPFDDLIDRSYLHVEDIHEDADVLKKWKEGSIRVLYSPKSILQTNPYPKLSNKCLKKGKTIIIKSDNDPRYRILFGPSGVKIYNWEFSSIDLVYKFENEQFILFQPEGRKVSNVDIL